ncbi:MAG TPA: hypothetical protein PLY87_05045 [Planctomycetaceae bacterium]|nr:hypothetical protein [Planctomycetaceae bacterium]
MLTIIWDETDGGNANHIAEHFLSFEDVEAVLAAPVARLFSRSSNLPMWLGYNLAGEETYVVFEWIDQDTVYPVTAFRREYTS